MRLRWFRRPLLSRLVIGMAAQACVIRGYLAIGRWALFLVRDP